jgi:hypothetical protein
MIKWLSTILSAILFVIVLGAVARVFWALAQIGWSWFGLF